MVEPRSYICYRTEGKLKIDGKLDEAPTSGWTAKAGDGYTGKMIITNLEKNAPNGENATIKVDFTGVGALTKVTA